MKVAKLSPHETMVLSSINSNLHFKWKVDLTYIKSNSDGGFPAGFNSTEARLL